MALDLPELKLQLRKVRWENPFGVAGNGSGLTYSLFPKWRAGVVLMPSGRCEVPCGIGAAMVQCLPWVKKGRKEGKCTEFCFEQMRILDSSAWQFLQRGAGVFPAHVGSGPGCFAGLPYGLGRLVTLSCTVLFCDSDEIPHTRGPSERQAGLCCW